MASLAIISLSAFLCSGVVEFAGERFTVEIAHTPSERAQGLMWREILSLSAGMLFVFETEAPRAFWMKNTSLPLDIYFFDTKKQFINKVDGLPFSTEHLLSKSASQYVLELHADNEDFVAGDEIKIVSISQECGDLSF